MSDELREDREHKRLTSPAGPGGSATSSLPPGFSLASREEDGPVPAPIGSWPGDGPTIFASAGSEAAARAELGYTGDGAKLPGQGGDGGPKSGPPPSLEDLIATRVRGEEKPAKPRGKLKSGAEPKGGREKGSAPRPHPSKKVKRVRGEIALAQHLTGEPLKEIAKQFGVSTPTIRKDVNDAIRGHLFTEARNFIQGTLVPKALHNIDAALEAGDTETARWLLDRTAMHVDARPYEGGGASGANESFESWRLELVRKRVTVTGDAPAGPADSPARGPESVARPPSPAIDAEVVEAGVRQKDGE